MSMLGGSWSQCVFTRRGGERVSGVIEEMNPLKEYEDQQSLCFALRLVVSQRREYCPIYLQI